MSAAETRKFRQLFGGRPGDTDIATLARAAAREGYAVLPIEPGGKRPLCTLTDVQARKADREAAQAARDAGKRSWERVRHACGIAHATNDPKVAHRVFKRLAEKHEGLNLGVDVLHSMALVADADTAAELASFTTLWARQEGVEELIQAAPTVRSPGVQDEDGTWSHSEGGHYWFLLPDDVEWGELAGTTSIPIGTDREHPAQLKVSGYVLVPPSDRDEGAYVMASDVHLAPDWMIDLVFDHIDKRRENQARSRDAALDADDQIRLHLAATEWHTILEPRDWVDSGKASRCGCPEWTAPGGHGSSKSATAHDLGCGEFETEDGFIHVWTDNPPGDLLQAGTKTFSKIQFVAWHDFGGDMGAAMRELGINTSADEQAEMAEWERILAGDEEAEPAQEKKPKADPDDDEDFLDDEDDEEEDDEEEDDEDPVAKLLGELISARDLDSIPPPDPLVDGLLERNSLARVIGKSGHGKSFFMIDLAGHIALGRPWQDRAVQQGDVVYMVAEGASGIRKRVRAWEQWHGAELGDSVQFLPRPVQVKDQEWLTWVRAMKRLKPALIVIDTQARVTAGANENGPEDMGILIQRAELLRKHTGACVVLVHHKGHSGDHGRGHTSVVAAMDAEIDVNKEGKNKIAILSSKQKDQEDFDPIRLELTQVEVVLDGEEMTSAVLVSPESGVTESDPFPQKPKIDETSSGRDRVAALIYRTFKGGSGGTKGEIKTLVLKHDRGPNGKPMVDRTFLRIWSLLEADGVLVKNGAKYQLSIEEADRLGLRDAD